MAGASAAWSGFSQEYQLLLNSIGSALQQRDSDALTAVRVKIEGLPPRTHTKRAPRNERDAKLHLILAALHMIDSAQDRAFDPSDMPLFNVSPPGVAGEANLPGVAVTSVRNPDARAEYLRRIEANNQKRVRYEREMNVRQARSDFLGTILAYSKRFSLTELDRGVLKNALDVQIKDSALKAELNTKLGDLVK